MPALGFSCNVRDKRIVVRGVLLRDGTAEEVFHFAAARGEDLALQLRSLGNALDTRLTDLEVESVVVRTADHHAARSLAEYVALRLRSEGILLSTARAHVDRVVCLTGKDIGKKCGTSKPKIDERAAELLSDKQKEATAAALAAERLRPDAPNL